MTLLKRQKLRPWKHFLKVLLLAAVCSKLYLKIYNKLTCLHFMFQSGKFDEAIDNLTKAIVLNPTSAIMYATRGKACIMFFLY